ncbi:MAG: SNF2-related protein [Mariprofundus sp.]|nr:SNF2-related protein [Mariprofundus sp.]
MQITVDGILSNINETFFNRGKVYFQQGRVLSLKVKVENSDLIVLLSSVKGSGSAVYQQEIEISATDDGFFIDSSCSCPVAYNCKHAVAVCLRYQEISKRPPASELKNAACFNWIDQFSESFNKIPSSLPQDTFLAYRLEVIENSGKISVDFYITRILKSGGFAKGRMISFNKLLDSSNYYFLPDYLQAEDVAICELLHANNAAYSFPVVTHGELGFHALNKILQTGRCFYGEFYQEPLQVGEERKLSTDWQEQASGDMQLELTVSPKATLLLTEPPMYFDPEHYVIGQLAELPYSALQLKSLLAAPSIPKALLPEFSQHIAQLLPASILPPPQAVEIEHINGQQPVPLLLLSATEEQGHHYHLMRLRFSYAGQEITALPETPESTLTVNNKLLCIHRKSDEEKQYIKQLTDLNFSIGGEQARTNDIFFVSCADSIIGVTNRWHDFLTNQVPQLEQQGWQVDIDDTFDMQFHQAEQWDVAINEQGNDWFDLHFDIEVNNEPLPLLPLIAQVLEQYEPDQLPESLTLNMGQGQYLNIASSQIKPVLVILYELYDHESLSQEGALRLSRFDAGRLEELEQQSTTNIQWCGGERLRKLGRQLKDFSGIKEVQPPHGLCANLRPYQQQGLNWLQFLHEYQLNGILADDMGLGKTVQTLAHLLLEKEQGRLQKPCLIVAPTSLMSNWRREVEQFTPALTVLILQGPDRHRYFSKINDFDIVLSTYPLLVRDEEILLAIDYHTVVLDEAQTVKNPKAKAAKMIRQISTDHRLCLTGTPMENHLGELWALFDFLMPGFLGDTRQFNALFRTPIEKHGDHERRLRLVDRISPFMLRRNKKDVVQELPEKTEIIQTISLDKKQAALYESIRISMEEKVRQTIASKGLARSHITILDALLKLRQVCCDPRLLPLKHAQTVQESAKLELLMQLLPEMVDEGRRILLFSQFTKMLGIIENELSSRKISYSKLTGQTRNRDAAIERFKQGEANVFLISLKAGGVGLNLTEADTVIHYDPWWNPAAENQATDRAHRIGQSKAVFVYKLVVENSVEEKIVAMQHKKQALAEAVYQQGKPDEALTITADAMQQLFAPL